MGKKKSKIKFIVPLIILSILLFFLSLYTPQVQETALPDDLQLTRTEFFPKIDTIGTELKDTITLDNRIDLESIYKMEYILTACSTKAELFLNNEKIGELNFAKCEDRYYSDEQDGNEYIHYQTLTFEKYFRFDDFPSRTFTYEIKITPTDGRIFVNGGSNIIAEEPSNTEVRMWREVQCTRSSQCIKVNIISNGKEQEIQPVCSYLSNKCSIDLNDISVEEKGVKVLDEELEPIKKGIPVYAQVLIISFFLLAIGLTLWRLRKK